MSEIKCCVYCEHFHCETEVTYSEITYDPAIQRCIKGHFYSHGMETEDMVDFVTRAMNCPDYELSKQVRQELNI
jgi:hypothetical protein